MVNSCHDLMITVLGIFMSYCLCTKVSDVKVNGNLFRWWLSIWNMTITLDRALLEKANQHFLLILPWFYHILTVHSDSESIHRLNNGLGQERHGLIVPRHNLTDTWKCALLGMFESNQSDSQEWSSHMKKVTKAIDRKLRIQVCYSQI